MSVPNRYLFVLDVESLGLQGPAISYGVVVVDLLRRKVVEEYYEGRLYGHDYILPSDKEWLRQNVFPHHKVTCYHRSELTEKFIGTWNGWVQQDAVIVTDCGWPVESNFLSACAKCSGDSSYVVFNKPLSAGDFHERSTFVQPYPVIDMASILWSRGVDPKTEFDRRENELPKHNPLNDARQTARILLENVVRYNEDER